MSDDEILKLNADEMEDARIERPEDVVTRQGLTDQEKYIVVEYMTSDGWYDDWQLKGATYFKHASKTSILSYLPIYIPHRLPRSC